MRWMIWGTGNAKEFCWGQTPLVGSVCQSWCKPELLDFGPPGLLPHFHMCLVGVGRRVADGPARFGDGDRPPRHPIRHELLNCLTEAQARTAAEAFSPLPPVGHGVSK